MPTSSSDGCNGISNNKGASFLKYLSNLSCNSLLARSGSGSLAPFCLYTLFCGWSNAFLNVAFEQYDSDGVRGISADGTKVYAQEGRLVIDQATPGSLIRIYDESGSEMKSFTTDGSRTETTLPANHVYIVKTPQKSVKIKL